MDTPAPATGRGLKELTDDARSVAVAAEGANRTGRYEGRLTTEEEAGLIGGVSLEGKRAQKEGNIKHFSFVLQDIL